MTYQYPGLILLAVFADGTVAGVLLMAWIMHLRQIIRGHTIRRRQASEEQAALRALEENPVEIDDDCMLCPICWENKHPGQVWSLHVGSLCMKHMLTAFPPDQYREEDQNYALQR